MHSDDDIQELLGSPGFRKLLRLKIGMCFLLSTLMLLVYFFYFAAIAWFPGWMGSATLAQGRVSNGIWFTVFCVIFSVLISGFYIWWANRYYDRALRAMLQNTTGSNASD